MSADNWLRVNRERRCPVCDHTDWCLIAKDGSAVLCPRTESEKWAGEAGWLHRLRSGRSGHRKRTRTRVIDYGPSPDFVELNAGFQRSVELERLRRLASGLGLAADVLKRFGVGWCHGREAWSFPMCDVNRRVIGIHLRRPNGKKFAIKGSRQGLFLPDELPSSPKTLLIAEGLTDAAALLSMGFPEIVGRPSYIGGYRLLTELVGEITPEMVVIVADADGPGQNGASNLANVLKCYVPSVRIISPPEELKDARGWLLAGGTAEDVQRAIDAAPSSQLSVVRREVRRGR